jgi:hypothetical protein
MMPISGADASAGADGFAPATAVRQHSELEALFREKGEPDWAKVAEVFAKAGLWDENDQRPTAESVERTWRVVRASAVSPSAPT